MERTNVQIKGAIDIDPAKEGKDIGTLAGVSPTGVKVTADMSLVLGNGDVDVVMLATTSSLAKTYEQLIQLLPYRVNVVSSCEELSYPWMANTELAAKIDKLAKENNVAVLGTGVNPGFLMDFLPVVMTGVCRNVRKITIERIQNASFSKKSGQVSACKNFTTKSRKVRCVM
jgi:4-hydroxy-tetrahydrodipicolinate reductase